MNQVSVNHRRRGHDLVFETQFAERIYGIGPDGESRTDLANAGSALDDKRFNADSPQR
jgi:hypothetical protein